MSSIHDWFQQNSNNFLEIHFCIYLYHIYFLLHIILGPCSTIQFIDESNSWRTHRRSSMCYVESIISETGEKNGNVLYYVLLKNCFLIGFTVLIMGLRNTSMVVRHWWLFSCFQQKKNWHHIYCWTLTIWFFFWMFASNFYNIYDIYE